MKRLNDNGVAFGKFCICIISGLLGIAIFVAAMVPIGVVCILMGLVENARELPAMVLPTAAFMLAFAVGAKFGYWVFTEDHDTPIDSERDDCEEE